MRRDRIIGMPAVRVQTLGEAHLVGVAHRIGNIADIIFVEFIVAVVQQLLGDPLAVGIQGVDIKIHAFFQQAVSGILTDDVSDAFVGNIVPKGMDHHTVCRW